MISKVLEARRLLGERNKGSALLSSFKTVSRISARWCGCVWAELIGVRVSATDTLIPSRLSREGLHRCRDLAMGVHGEGKR